MEILLNIEAVASEQNVKGLRRLYDDVESHIRSLKSLGVTPDSYGSLLSPVLLNKLPPELRLIVSRKVSDSHWMLIHYSRLWRKSCLLGNEVTLQLRHHLVTPRTNLAQPQPCSFRIHTLPLQVLHAAIVNSRTLQPVVPQ